MTDRELMQMALDALEDVADDAEESHKTVSAIKALRARLAQPEQEPVAKYTGEVYRCPMVNLYQDIPVGTLLYTTPPQRESVYCGCGDEIVAGDGARCGTCVAVKYKENKWIGLTDEEHIQIAIDCGCLSADWVFYGAAVERKLKEKNATYL